MSYLRGLCFFTYSDVLHILCCLFALFVFALCILCFNRHDITEILLKGALNTINQPYVASFSSLSLRYSLIFIFSNLLTNHDEDYSRGTSCA